MHESTGTRERDAASSKQRTLERDTDVDQRPHGRAKKTRLPGRVKTSLSLMRRPHHNAGYFSCVPDGRNVRIEPDFEIETTLTIKSVNGSGF
jgi:hypothetical protein